MNRTRYAAATLAALTLYAVPIGTAVALDGEVGPASWGEATDDRPTVTTIEPEYTVHDCDGTATVINRYVTRDVETGDVVGVVEHTSTWVSDWQQRDALGIDLPAECYEPQPEPTPVPEPFPETHPAPVVFDGYNPPAGELG